MIKRNSSNSAIDYEPATIPTVFQRTVNRLGPQTAMRQKKYGLWHDLSWQDYHRQARCAARSLQELGLRKGDFVAIIGENGPEWVILDMAIMMTGGITVGIYTTSAWQQVEYVVNHSGCRFLFAENEEQVDKWLQMRPNTPQLEKVIFWEEKGLHELVDPQLLSWRDFMVLGEKADTQEKNEQLDAITASIQPDDLAILVYTSGTTGPPKGAMLSHYNLTWIGHNIGQVDPAMSVKADDEVMSFLPLCHIFERLFSVYVSITWGYVVNFVESTDTVPENLREISPTIGYAVPRVWEKFHSSIVLRMADAKPLKRLAYQVACRIGFRYADRQLAHRPPGFLLKTGYFLAYWGVLYFIRKRLGLERMRYAFSGAAPIAPDVIRFFNAIGLKLVEGYGQTESAGVITASTIKEFRLGKVGRAIAGCAVRIADDGEILARSPGVFMGYYLDPEKTVETLAEGWLHTGDIGELDEDGFLRIIDRKKDIIITAAGKNIAPQYIENKLKFSPYINDAIVIGDRRKFLIALIVLDEENINKYARDHRIQYATYADLSEHPDIRKLIQEEIDKTNKELARVENVRKFTILPKRLYEEDGEVTPTMKVKRKFINETYFDLIEEMYA